MIHILNPEVVKIHALTFDEKNEFIVFSKGPGGRKNDKNDTFRVAPINKFN